MTGTNAQAPRRLRALAGAVLALLIMSMLPVAPLAEAATELPLTAGTVVTVNTAVGAVTIADSRGVTAAYRLAAGAELIVYDRPARLADLLPGLAVWFHARQGEIVLLTAPAAWQSPAAAPPATTAPERVAGRLQYVDGSKVAIIVAGGEAAVYDRTAQTTAYRAGEPVPAAALAPGDPVTLTLSGPGQTEVLRIDAQPAPYPAVQLYRGRLESVWHGRGEFVLQRVERLAHGRWQAVAPWLRLPLATGAEIFLNGDPADLAAVGRQGIDQLVYVAVATDGSGAALKVSVVPPASALFMSTPAGVQYGTGEIVFPDEYGTVATGPGTILIRNGRLVDFYGLSPEGSFTVALGPASGTGLPDLLAPPYAPERYAAAAVQDTYLPYGIALHWGQLYDVATGQLTLRYARRFAPYQFETVQNYWSANVALNYGLAVQGRDLRNGANEPFDRFELDRQVGLLTYAPNQMRGEWVLAATRNGELIALDVLPGLPGGGQYPDLMTALVTAGTLRAAGSAAAGVAGSGELLLENPVTWNALTGRWEPDPLNWPLAVPETALWLGPNGRVAPGGLAPGTPVTVLRGASDVYIVLIR